MQPSLQELLDVAIDCAYLAGRRALAYFNTGVAVESKADLTPVTCADREAEALIRQRIARYFPTHAIVGEEHGDTAGDADYRWIIDPVDGTKSFIHGVPLWGVLIGIEVKGDPSVGVIYHAALDEMVAAAKGLGCRWNGRPARVSTISTLADATLTCSSALSAMKRSDAFERLAAQTKLQRGWGDCYGYTLVATGRADIMLDAAMKLWDCAPLPPIIEEAGGRYADWKGRRTIRGGDAVASNAALYEPTIAILRAEQRRAG